ncbi:LysM peptidoglycan-binding domain-containing protein [bacterium]|nr:LysM peptidoglycan-binding domain-containing protein [bacterium]
MAKSSWNKGTRVLLDAGDVTPIPKQPTVTSGDIVPPSPALDNFDGFKALESTFKGLVDIINQSGVISNPHLNAEMKKISDQFNVGAAKQDFKPFRDTSAAQESLTGTRGFEAGQKIVVEKGDTLDSIVEKYPYNKEEFLKANPQIKDPNLIQVGQEISVPAVDRMASTGLVEPINLNQSEVTEIAKELPEDMQNSVIKSKPESVEEINKTIFDATTFSGQISTPQKGDDPLTWIAQNTYGLNENDPTFQKAFKQVANIDPSKTPWCAAFGAFVLKNLGVKLPERAQLNPNLAFNFVELGSEVYNHNPTTNKTWAGSISDVKTGDVIVFNNAKRRSNGSFKYGTGHLSFIVGVEPDGSILALGGNQGGGKEVTVTKYSPDIIKKYYKGGFTVRRIDELGLNQTDPAILAEITKNISQGTAER